MKLQIKFKEEYYDCDHAGCSGGEVHTLTMVDEEGNVFTDTSGGCYGSDMYDQAGAIKVALELLGHEVTIYD